MKWHEFEKAAPEIARAGAERFRAARLAFIGTLRLDGWPRINPVEPLFISGDLVLGMIWQSKKALDLLRDPRCTLHSVLTDPDENEGEFKLRGRARPPADEYYSEQIRTLWGMDPSAALHVFWIDIIDASLTTYDFEGGLISVARWDANTGTSEIRRHYP
ncbi:MAG TPA: pyridoxamine 5'-phosphate oxidase family protein [Terriglobales bacterium]|nr:pyridoxamine 5'-phosphate oxidase family protein [Terriglobales bacterium]